MQYGPDVWKLKIANGPELISATFSTFNAHPGHDRQTFPDSYPGPEYIGMIGAAEKKTLGYKFFGRGCDSVYKLSFIVPHSAKDLKFIFSSSGLEDLANESWGLDNVKVEVIRELPKLSAEQFDKLWQQLESKDPMEAFEAFCTLVPATDAKQFLRKKLTGYSPPTKEQIKKLIVDLDNDDWKVRENASRRLSSLDATTAAQLTEALQSVKSPEVRARLKEIMDNIGSQKSAELMRIGRAKRLLKIITWQEEQN